MNKLANRLRRDCSRYSLHLFIFSRLLSLFFNVDTGLLLTTLGWNSFVALLSSGGRGLNSCLLGDDILYNALALTVRYGYA